MTFDFEFALSIFPALLWSSLVTIGFSLVIAGLSLTGGVVLTIVRALKFAPLSLIILLYISFVRGTPTLVQIFLFYYALPSVGLDLSPVEAGIAALTFNSVVFVSECIRGGLASIGPGQIEASVALGLGTRPIWLRVVLPQVLTNVIPTLVSEFTYVVKGTALLSTITIVELFRTAQRISNLHFRPFETFLVAGIIFLLINLTVSKISDGVGARILVRQGRSGQSGP